MRFPTACTVAASFALQLSCATDPPPSRFSALLDWKSLPVLGDASYRQFSSYERVSNPDALGPAGNQDFNHFLAKCGDRPAVLWMGVDDTSPCEPGHGGYLIARIDGRKGFVSRIWMTTLPTYTKEKIRIYVDDLSSAAYEAPISNWAQRRDPLFAEPLVGPRSGSVVSYLPITFSEQLRIYLDDLNTAGTYFYHVDVQLDVDAPAPFSNEPISPKESEALNDLLLNYHTIPKGGSNLISIPISSVVTAGSTAEIVRGTGKGTAQETVLTFPNAAYDELRQVHLRIRFDDAAEDHVRVPLLSFFGAEWSIAPYATLPLRLVENGEGITMAVSFPMPFTSKMVISLENGGTSDLEVEGRTTLDKDIPAGGWGYFGSAYLSATAPLPANALHPIVSIRGRGKYVGTFMFMEGHRDPAFPFPDPFNFLEGDETGLIDGLMAIPGTGTEDYFNGAFYFITGPFDSAFAGLNFKSGDAANYGGKVSTYRWHVLTDSINFRDSFDLTLEYAANNPALADRYSSVAYYYLPP